MKKLIALAVAAASVPAMAAVSLSGGVEVSYSNKDAGTAQAVAGGAAAAVAESKTIGAEQVTLGVSASSELDNGMTISTSYTIHGAGDAVTNDGGEGSVTVSGAFGSLSVGDVGGPLDGRDGQAAATAENDLSAAFGGDMSVVYSLPTIVEGLNISAGMSAKNGGDAGVGEDAQGVAFDYSVAGFKVYAGVEESTTAAVALSRATRYATASEISTLDGTSDAAAQALVTKFAGNTAILAGTDAAGTAIASNTNVTATTVLQVTTAAKNKKENEVIGYGVSYSVNGFTVAANYAEKEVKDTGTGTVTKYEKQAYGVAYTTGALTLAYNNLEDETNGAKVEESDTASVAYSLGGGASVYAASTSRDIGKNDETTVGIKFSF